MCEIAGRKVTRVRLTMMVKEGIDAERGWHSKTLKGNRSVQTGKELLRGHSRSKGGQGIPRKCLCCVWLFPAPWTVAHQVPLSMGFSQARYQSELAFPSLENLPDPRIEPVSLGSPALAGDSLPTKSPGKPGKCLELCKLGAYLGTTLRS